MSHPNESTTAQRVGFMIGAGATALALLAAVGLGLYVLGTWTYRALYPCPATAAVSLSAGFAVINPIPQNPQKATEGGTQTAETQVATQKPDTEKVGKGPIEFQVYGAVQKLGKPVTTGMVKLTVEKLVGDYRKSELVSIDINGRFGTSFDDLKVGDQIRVQAEVSSQELAGDRPLAEELYLGSPAPIRMRTTSYVVIGLALMVSIVVFGYAFTGPQNPRKNRVAIIYSYVVIGVALLAPLIVPYTLVHAFPGLMEAMKDTPVGLVIAKPDADSKDSQSQWVLNIGGHFSSTSEGDATPIGGGGLAIPFYVIILSMMGATINMTRQVPLLQDQSENAKFNLGLMTTAWRGLGRAFNFNRPPVTLDHVDIAEQSRGSDQTSGRQAGDWRTGLLNQYMYLVSAPFIAIATYYILHLLGTTKVPILVLMSFSVGLISEHILIAITDFADSVIRGLKKQQEMQATAAAASGESDVTKLRGTSAEHPGDNREPALDEQSGKVSSQADRPQESGQLGEKPESENTR